MSVRVEGGNGHFEFFNTPEEASAEAHARGFCGEPCRCTLLMCTIRLEETHPYHVYPAHGCQQTEDDIEDQLSVDLGMEMSRVPVGADSKSTLSLEDLIQAEMSMLRELSA